MTYQPDDTFIPAIVAALGNLARTQIAGLGTVYNEEPDGPPENNSVIFPLASFKIINETNGKMTINIVFAMHYLVTMTSSLQDLKAVRRYLLPFLQVYGGWPNQDLGGVARSVSAKMGGTPRVTWAQQQFQALVVNIEVQTEINIPTF